MFNTLLNRHVLTDMLNRQSRARLRRQGERRRASLPPASSLAIEALAAPVGHGGSGGVDGDGALLLEGVGVEIRSDHAELGLVRDTTNISPFFFFFGKSRRINHLPWFDFCGHFPRILSMLAPSRLTPHRPSVTLLGSAPTHVHTHRILPVKGAGLCYSRVR